MFLWYIPLEVALLISEMQAVKASFATALSPAATAASTFLMYVFTFVLIALFLAVFVSITLILFFAYLIFAKVGTSNMITLILLIYNSGFCLQRDTGAIDKTYCYII